VTGGSDGRVIIFSLASFETIHRLCAHDNSVTSLQFDDRFLITGGNDGHVKLFDLVTGHLIRELTEPCEAVWRINFKDDKCVILCKRAGKTVMEILSFKPSEEDL
jgi:F-box and WD-40 domain protein CDC4